MKALSSSFIDIPWFVSRDSHMLPVQGVLGELTMSEGFTEATGNYWLTRYVDTVCGRNYLSPKPGLLPAHSQQLAPSSIRCCKPEI